MTRQEWVRVQYVPGTNSKAGRTTVTVTLVEGTRVAKWTESTYSRGVRRATKAARTGAEHLMAQLVEAEQEDAA